MSHIQNTLSDLNNHLFAEIERLSDEDVKGEDLKTEIERARAISSIATNIIQNGALALKAEEFKAEYYSAKKCSLPPFLEGKD